MQACVCKCMYLHEQILIYAYVYSYVWYKPYLNLSCAGWFIAPDGLAWLGLGGNWCGGWGARSQTGPGLVSAGFAQAFWGEGGVWRSGEGAGVGGAADWTPLGPLPLGSRSIYCFET